MKNSKADTSINRWDYLVDFQIQDRSLVGDEDDGDLIHSFTGRIIYRPEEEKGITIGRIRGERLDVGEAINRQVSLFDACDARSGELCQVYETIFDGRKGMVREDLGLESFGDVLVVHEMRIVPKYRGRNLGLLAMLKTIKTMGGGCAVAVIKPFPLQFSARCNEKNKPGFTKAQQKLRDYWKRLGFVWVDGSDYYCLDLACKTPEVEDILGEKLEV